MKIDGLNMKYAKYIKSSGIYAIVNINNDKFYIGSSKDIIERWSNHLYHLEKNKHHSSILQNHYNKYGESDLVFSILLGCDKENLIEHELGIKISSSILKYSGLQFTANELYRKMKEVI